MSHKAISGTNDSEQAVFSTPQGKNEDVTMMSILDTTPNPNAEYYSAPVGIVTLTATLALVTFVGNGLVLVVSIRRPFLQPATNLMVAALAFMDLNVAVTLAMKEVQYLDPQRMSSFYNCAIAMAFSVWNGVGSMSVLLGKTKLSEPVPMGLLPDM